MSGVDGVGRGNYAANWNTDSTGLGNGKAQNRGDSQVPDLNLCGLDESSPNLGKPSVTFTREMGQSCAGAVPSLGAAVMSVLVETTAAQRRDNTRMAQAEAEYQADNMEKEAETMKSKAVTQLILGCIEGGITVGFAAASMIVSSVQLHEARQGLKDAASKAATETAQSVASEIVDDVAEAASGAVDSGLKGANKILASAKSTYDKALAEGLTMVGQGAAKIINAGAQYSGTMDDAEIKRLEADTKRSEARQQQLESLNNALSDVLRKAIETEEEAQRAQNQALARILG